MEQCDLERGDGTKSFNCTLDLSFDPQQFIGDLTSCLTPETAGEMEKSFRSTVYAMKVYKRAAAEIDRDLSDFLMGWQFDEDFFRFELLEFTKIKSP